MRSRTLGATAVLLVAVWLAGCAGLERENIYPGELPGTKDKPLPGGDVKRQGIFGTGGLTLFGGGDKETGTGSTGWVAK